jgi:signal recognition particle subunit SRP68
MADTDNPPAPPPVTLSLNALRIVKDAQQQHGLRHGDYMRYRFVFHFALLNAFISFTYSQYCAQRVRRVRKSVKFMNQHKSGLKHAAKFAYRPVSKKSINDHRFVILCVHIFDVNIYRFRFLLIPLFDAERCWAYAMQLKHDTARETNKRLQHHMMCKLRRSMKHSNALSRVCVQLKSVRFYLPLYVFISHFCFRSMRRQSWRHVRTTHGFMDVFISNHENGQRQLSL